MSATQLIGEIPVFIFLRATASVFRVVVLRTGISLAAEPWGLLALLSFIVGQNVIGILPLRIVVHQVAFFIKRVWSTRRIFGILQSLRNFVHNYQKRK